MNNDTAMLDVQYFDGRTPVGTRATVIFGSREIKVIGEKINGAYPTDWLRVSPRVGEASRFVALPDGGQLQCPDHPFLDKLPHEIESEGFVSWLEQRLQVAVACVAIIAVLLVSGYFYGLPMAAKRIAARIPIETEQTLGDGALAWLDEHKWFKPTKLSPKIRKAILEHFAQLHRGLPNDSHYRLLFRDSPLVGPNAFALPGGTIVVTDDMIKLAKTGDEVMAVLGHEIGHIELHHTMRHILQDSAAAAIAATVTSDASTLTAAVAGLPAVLVQTRYSREFETEADTFAFKLLKRHGISPNAFATLMQRLMRKHGNRRRYFAFLSSHPLTSTRIERAREAAAE